MRKPVPIPDPEALRTKLKAAYQPLLDLGIPEDDLIALISSDRFWRANKINKSIMLNDLLKQNKEK